MRSILFATLCSLALPCAAQEAWLLDDTHVVAVRPSGADEEAAKAAEQELVDWVKARVAAAKAPQVFVVTPDSALTLVADLGKAGHRLVERKGGDLRKLSPKHTKVYRALADYASQLQQAEGFQGRRKVQDEVVKGLRAQEGLAGPLRDVILFSKSKQEQVFLATALGGIPAGPWHGQVLALPEASIVLSLARHMPEGAETLAALCAAYPRQQETTCKTALLREIAKRIGPKGDATFLREVAKDGEAPLQLRAEAVTSLGRRNDPKDYEVLAAIAEKGEKGELALRQRAIVGAASADGVKAIKLLEKLCEDPELRIRAATVLALGRIGSPEALALLRKVAKDDAADAIRARAERMLKALERKQQPKK
jgi:HEAT repeat protein